MSVLKQFEHLRIRLEVIESATNFFSKDSCIGRGGFGKVYKGELLHSNGHTIVALKHLDRAFGQGDSEFWKEVITLSVYRHQNTVSLVGFCDEKGEKILAYEYASNRSLDLHLDNKDLTWVQRLSVCIGAARGVAYLHDPGETQQRVLHRDIKSSNILLDENWNARIADLGLSRFGPANQKYTFLVTNNTVGTIGYCDPLYLESGILTKESDVYSFGVVLFEVLCGRLCFSNNGSFTQLIRRHYRQNSLNEIVWGNIRDEIHPSSLKAFSKIAYQCLKSDNEKRPVMNDVVSELETALLYQLSTASVSTKASQPGFEKLKPEKVNLEEQVRLHDQYKWLETRGVGEENMVQNLPKDPRRGIKRHICVDLVKRGGEEEAELTTHSLGKQKMLMKLRKPPYSNFTDDADYQRILGAFGFCRTRAASMIQAVWRRYSKWKVLDRHLNEEVRNNGGGIARTSNSSGATVWDLLKLKSETERRSMQQWRELLMKIQKPRSKT